VERINNCGDFHQFMTLYFANQKHLEKAEYQYLPYSMVCGKAFEKESPIQKRREISITNLFIFKQIETPTHKCHSKSQPIFWNTPVRSLRQGQYPWRRQRQWRRTPHCHQVHHSRRNPRSQNPRPLPPIRSAHSNPKTPIHL
jgi:hypothetical protein